MPDELCYGDSSPSTHGQFLAKPDQIGAETGPKPAQKPPETAQIRPEGFVPARSGHWRISLRVTLDYLRWAQGLADHCGISVTRAVQAGLSNLADKHGYTPREPPRFLPKRKCYRAEEVPPRSHG